MECDWRTKWLDAECRWQNADTYSELRCGMEYHCMADSNEPQYACRAHGNSAYTPDRRCAADWWNSELDGDMG